MIRRAFFSALASLGVGCLPGQAAAQPTEKKKIFRHDGSIWRQVSWEDIRGGDEILAMSLFGGELKKLERLTVCVDTPREPTHYTIKGERAIRCTQTTHHCDILSDILYDPTAKEVVINIHCPECAYDFVFSRPAVWPANCLGMPRTFWPECPGCARLVKVSPTGDIGPAIRSVMGERVPEGVLENPGSPQSWDERDERKI